MTKTSARKPPPRKPYFAATRQGKSRVAVSLDPAVHKDLKRLAIDLDLTLEGLLQKAIEDLLGILPSGWLLGWVFKLPFVGKLADKFYRWFARNRYRFGCGEHCQFRPEQLDYGEER